MGKQENPRQCHLSWVYCYRDHREPVCRHCTLSLTQPNPDTILTLSLSLMLALTETLFVDGKGDERMRAAGKQKERQIPFRRVGHLQEIT